jgi:dihydrolipoamide dehydrogenase
MVYDVLIIGGGPGGYVCALRSAQLGLKVALVEEKKLGGVCLHWGCIPTKALYAATRLLRQASTATEMGIEFGAPTLDLARLAAWKDGVIARLAGGIEDLVKAAGIDVFTDRACLAGPNAVRVSCGETLAAANIVLATGSRPIEIPGFSFSHPRIWSSDDALALEAVPARLAIVGGGVIGLELGTIYRRLGSDVTIIELLPEILPTLDVDRRAVAAVKRGLVASGIRILTGSSATSCEDRGDCLTLTMSDGSTLDVERVLIAVGRRPSSAELGLETVGLEPDRRGTLAVGPGYATSHPDRCWRTRPQRRESRWRTLSRESHLTPFRRRRSRKWSSRIPRWPRSDCPRPRHVRPTGRSLSEGSRTPDWARRSACGSLRASSRSWLMPPIIASWA